MTKYRAQPTEVEGIRFASIREAQRYQELRLLERAGEIRNLETQPSFPITINGRQVRVRSKGYPNGRAMKAVMDFAYFDGNRRVIEDVKGMDTPVSRIKRALVEAIYGVRVEIVK